MSLTEQLRTCPSCAVANPSTRELCRSCGVDLEDGTLLPRPVRREAPDPPNGRDAPPGRRHRWIWTVLGVLVVVVVLVGALTLAGLGPLARGPATPAVAFVADRYPDDAGPLALSSVATLTTSPDLDAEAAAAIVDGDATTAWRSDGTAAADREVLDTIDLLLLEPAWIDRIELRNGDHLDREAYDASARLREVRLRFDGGVVVRAELLDLGLRAQVVELPEPILTTDVRIDILRAVAGPNDQLAVSGIDLIGWPATGGDVTAAEERAVAEPASGPVAPPVPGGLSPTDPSP